MHGRHWAAEGLGIRAVGVSMLSPPSPALIRHDKGTSCPILRDGLGNSVALVDKGDLFLNEGHARGFALDDIRRIGEEYSLRKI